MPNDKIKHGRSKLISNYGGVGSLIETQDCSIIIETFDNWQYKDLANRLSTYIIKDDRLLNRLKNRFPNIRHIVQIPTDKNSFTDQVRPSANYFSKWFYCPHSKCNRFADYNEWKRRWVAAGKKIDYFNPPKCSNPDCNEEVLEQIRFVMTCKDGHIHDIPWKHWNTFLPEDLTDIEDDNADDETSNVKPQGPQIDLSRTCCQSQDLRYEISKENTELTGIRVVCKTCKAVRTLKGIFNYQTDCFGKKYWLGMTNGKWADEECKQQTKVVVKTSNSVYYANSLSSIYIPEMQTPITGEVRIEIDNLIDSGEFSTEEIIKNISITKKIPKDVLRSYLQTGNVTFIPDIVFRETEYNYLLKGEHPENNQLKFRLLECLTQTFGFEKLVKLEKLKKITVQTSFTRQEPIDVDSILQEDNIFNQDYLVKRQSVSKNNFDTKLLPGIESYGEGILFVLDKDKLNRWELQDDVIERTKILIKNAKNSSWQYHKIIARTLTPRKVLIHTLSHILIRELEYVCGYPASSIQERLYVSDTMHGFLISAFDGTDGYLGGLANLCNDLEKLNEIIRSAINRANDCSSDPICMESEGQGVSQLNLAACHSCTLTPEITCELSNLFLDRKLLVNEAFGYFKSILQF
ncbi:MAG: DUF1998 domain-containing protein [Bacteroidales bacterium]|jgi:hypothetical protein